MRKRYSIVAAVMFVMAAVLVVFLATGCGPGFLNMGGDDGCANLETRCNGDILQICNAHKIWETAAKCGDLEPGNWACCPSEGEFRCLKEEDCQ